MYESSILLLSPVPFVIVLRTDMYLKIWYSGEIICTHIYVSVFHEEVCRMPRTSRLHSTKTRVRTYTLLGLHYIWKFPSVLCVIALKYLSSHCKLMYSHNVKNNVSKSLLSEMFTHTFREIHIVGCFFEWRCDYLCQQPIQIRRPYT